MPDGGGPLHRGDVVMQPPRRRLSVVDVGFGAVLVVAAAAIWRAGRGLIFIGDEWDWIQNRATPSSDSLLTGFNDQWITVVIAVHQGLYHSVGFDSHVPYRLVILLTHLGAALLLFRYLRLRCTGWIALALAGVFALYGFSAQVLTWPATLGWSMAVAAVIGALLLIDEAKTWSDRCACALLCVAVASSGAALPFVVGIAVESSLRRNRRAMWVPLVPLALYAVWWVTHRGPDTTASASVGETIRFGWAVLTQSVGTLLGISARGADAQAALVVVVVALAAVWLALGRPWSPRLIGNVTALVTLTVVLSVTRAGGIESPGNVAAWYSYAVSASILLLVGELAALARARISPRSTVTKAIVVGCVLGVAMWSVGWNLLQLERTTDVYRKIAEREHAQLGVLEVIGSEVQPTFKPLVYAPTFTAGRYQEIVAEDGGFGWPIARIRRSGDLARQAADDTLVRGLDVRLRSYARTGTVPPQGQIAVPAGTGVVDGCYAVHADDPELSAAVEVDASELDLIIRSASGTAEVRVGAFAGASQSIGTVSAGQTVRVSAPHMPEVGPWNLLIRTRGAVRLCAPASSATP